MANAVESEAPLTKKNYFSFKKRSLGWNQWGLHSQGKWRNVDENKKGTGNWGGQVNS